MPIGAFEARQCVTDLERTDSSRATFVSALMEADRIPLVRASLVNA
jgi:hypothetical protein